jgi:hypothetical protein
MISDVNLEKRLKEIDLEIRNLNKLRRGQAHRKNNKTFMVQSKRKLRNLLREQKELVKQLHDEGFAIDKSSMSAIHTNQLRQNMERLCQSIMGIKPSHSDVKEFAEDFWEWSNVVKQTKTSSDSVKTRIHETFNRYKTRFHIDVLSRRYHLVLDRTWAPIFLEYFKNDQTEIGNEAQASLEERYPCHEEELEQHSVSRENIVKEIQTEKPSETWLAKRTPTRPTIGKTGEIAETLYNLILGLGEVSCRRFQPYICFYKGKPTSESIFAVLLRSKTGVTIRIRTDPDTSARAD